MGNKKMYEISIDGWESSFTARWMLTEDERAILFRLSEAVMNDKYAEHIGFSVYPVDEEADK